MNETRPSNTGTPSDPFVGLWKVLRPSIKRTIVDRQELPRCEKPTNIEMPPAYQAIKDWSYSRTGSEISQTVINNRRFDRSVNLASIISNSTDGIVPLTGLAQSPTDKLQVEITTYQRAGVKSTNRVLDVIPLQYDTSTDDEIGRDCENALGASISGPNQDIRVRVSNGWVTLSGRVAWGYERWAAEAAISNLRGVNGVNSQVTVRPLVAQREVENNLNCVLFGPNGDANGMPSELYVKIVRDQVTLSGKVQSQSDRSAARNAVLSTPGVHKLIDNTVLSEQA